MTVQPHWARRACAARCHTGCVREVLFTEDPGEVLQVAGEFLVTDPARHNVVLTLLHGSHARGGRGHYWVSMRDGVVDGVVHQAPIDFFATTTPMDDEAVVACVGAIVEAGVSLPGVSAVAATAARFAGEWTEHHKAGARPVEGQRLYQLEDLFIPNGVPGTLRQAGLEDMGLLSEWRAGYAGDTESAQDLVRVRRSVEEGATWIWESDGPVSTCVCVAPVAGVCRIGAVYTPPPLRNHGFAAACVAAISAKVRSRGYDCVLYTQLQNAVSNSIYRNLGYRAIAEVVRYEFTN
jgi:uncharacterized protein